MLPNCSEISESRMLSGAYRDRSSLKHFASKNKDVKRERFAPLLALIQGTFLLRVSKIQRPIIPNSEVTNNDNDKHG